MKYGLFLGCNMPALRPDVERAIRLTMPNLGIELEDMQGYVCCPAFGSFPSMDEEAQLAVNAWNLTIAEEKGIDIMVECGSCYSSLSTGRHHLLHNKDKRDRINELLSKTGKQYQGTIRPRHITDVLYNEVGTEKIKSTITKTLDGIHAVVQYPCHTLYPSDILGFEDNSAQPHILADLLSALGAEVDHFSLEYQCCGGAGGFHGSSHAEATEFTKKKFDSIKKETKAEFMVVSCITCLMYLDNVQKELNQGNGNYSLPVFDYNQILALCMQFAPNEVAGISSIPRNKIIEKVL